MKQTKGKYLRKETAENTTWDQVIASANKLSSGQGGTGKTWLSKIRIGDETATSYDDATETVKAAIREAIAMDNRIAADPAPFIVLSQYKDSCIEYIVRVWCKNADYWDVYFGLNENVRESFARHGVQMTYNRINVHMMDK